jgi:hypothetical protein
MEFRGQNRNFHVADAQTNPGESLNRAIGKRSTSCPDQGDESILLRQKLRTQRPTDAVLEGLGAVDALLVAKGFGPRADARNELANRPIVERRL